MASAHGRLGLPLACSLGPNDGDALLPFSRPFVGWLAGWLGFWLGGLRSEAKGAA